MKLLINLVCYVFCLFFIVSPLVAEEVDVKQSSDQFIEFWADNTATNKDISNVKEAHKVIKKFFKAFNNTDNNALRNYTHYPHVRINGSQVTIWREDKPWVMDFEYLRKEQNWHHSSLDYAVPILVKNDRIFFKIGFTRHNLDGKAYFKEEGEWVLVKEKGKWFVFLISY